MARTKKKAPPRVGTRRKAKTAAKRKPARKTGRVPPRQRGGKTLAQILKKAAKEKRPTRFRYDGDGNIIGVYVPLKHQTKAEQKRATKAMVSACSAGSYRQGVSPTKTCGYRGLKPSAQAGRGLAYARWGFPKGWPKPKRVNNPGYNVAGLRVKTFKDEDGDWGYVVYDVGGAPLTISSGEPSEQIAAREAKAEARFQAEILEIERREFITGNPTPKFEVSVTYSTTTPESVEMGDFEDTGFTVEPEPATLEDIVGYAEQYGISPRDRSDYTDWWDSDWSVESYRTGEEIMHSLHVRKLGKGKRGARLDDRTFDRINKILGGKAYREKNPRRSRRTKNTGKSSKRATNVRSLVAKAMK